MKSNIDSRENVLVNPTMPKIPKPMTHKECVDDASYWLRGKCNVVLPEFFCWNDELADVIGLKSRETILIECKVSRADFLKDKKKLFRIEPESGMGDLRYYCCPKGLIGIDEVPESWGLIYIYPSRAIRRVKEAYYQPKNLKAEYHLLYYYAKRAVEAGVHKKILETRSGL